MVKSPMSQKASIWDGIFGSSISMKEHTVTGWREAKSCNSKWESHTQMLNRTGTQHLFSYLNTLWTPCLWSFKFEGIIPTKMECFQEVNIINVEQLAVRLVLCWNIWDWGFCFFPLPPFFTYDYAMRWCPSENQELICTMPLITVTSCVPPFSIAEINVCSLGYLVWIIY